MFSAEHLFQAGQKKRRSVGIKPFYSNASYSFELKKTA